MIWFVVACVGWKESPRDFPEPLDWGVPADAVGVDSAADMEADEPYTTSMENYLYESLGQAPGIRDAVPTASRDNAWATTSWLIGMENWEAICGLPSMYELTSQQALRGLAVDASESTLYFSSDDFGSSGFVGAYDIESTRTTVLPWTEGDERGHGALTVADVGGEEYLYVASTGGVWPTIRRTTTADPTRGESVWRGAPLVAPGGLAVTGDGTVWVSDAAAGRGRTGALIRIDTEGAEIVLEGFEAGDPAGVALRLDESAVLVSTVEGAATILVYEIATGNLSRLHDAFERFNGAGGLHRLADEDRFAWVGDGAEVIQFGFVD